MALYDTEQMIRDLEALYKAQLNTEITAVDTDKADSITLDQIPTDQYFMVVLNKRVLNIRGFFIFFDITENPPQQVQLDNFQENVTLRVSACTLDSGQADLDELVFRLFRYQRAIKQVLFNNLDVFKGYSKPLVKALEPAAFPLSNKVDILSMGIQVTASITSN